MQSGLPYTVEETVYYQPTVEEMVYSQPTRCGPAVGAINSFIISLTSSFLICKLRVTWYLTHEIAMRV